MSLDYKPMNGKAGTIFCSLTRKSDLFTTASISFNVVNFDESDEPSELNDEFVNLAGDLIKDHYGYHKRISFGLINARSSVMFSEDNKHKIEKLIMWINQVNQNPRKYKLKIKYRDGVISSTLHDAVMIGETGLKELSPKSNSAQIIELTFKARSYHQLNYTSPDSHFIVEAQASNAGARIVFVTQDSETNESGTINILTL